jgi:diguanylate cyclase (GGDEF)-like protein
MTARATLRSKIGRRSIATRLVALVLVPLAAVAGLLSVRIDDGRAKITQARRLDLLVSEAVGLGRLHALLNVERGAVHGIVMVHEAGLTIEQTTQLIGFDLGQTRADVEVLIDATLVNLKRLSANPIDVQIDALLARRDSLVAPNASVSFADTEMLFDSLATLITNRQNTASRDIERIIAGGVGTSASADELGQRLASASEFNRLVRSIGEQTVFLGLLVSRPDKLDERAPIAAGFAVANQSEALKSLRNDPSLRTSALAPTAKLALAWEAVQADALREIGLTTMEPRNIDQLASARISAQIGRVAIAWLSAAQDVYAQQVGQLSAATAVIVAETEASMRRQLTLAAAIVGGTVVWTIAVSMSLTRPLRRLTRRAERLRDGNLNDQPMGATGAREVAALSGTFDQLSSNMRMINSQIEALGAGRIYDDVLDQALPGQFGVGMRQSIEEVTRLTERLAEQAKRDAMTGLPNRAAVLERLAEALDRSSRNGGDIALLFLDLDGFKAVNDTYGHGAGDAVLKTVASRFAEAIRGGELVARLGGDEFVVVADASAPLEQIVKLGERLIAIVEEPIAFGDAFFRLSASVGIAFADSDSTPMSILGYADQAVYEAKRSGKGRVVCFDASMQALAHDRAEIELALRRALDVGEFKLHIQPIVDTKTRQVVAGEALIRWYREGHGVVQPGDFISVAEESWLIVEIGQFVMSEACRLLSQWNRQGTPRPLSINVAGRHLADGDLVHDVAAALAMHNTPAHLLSVELTETQLVMDLDHGAKVLNDLRALGVRVALDDFGTGFSSLNYLRQLPIDTMKIDRSYINELPGDLQSGSIVSSLQQLATSLHLEVVAEGVETAEQVEFLSALGCTKLQGFYFAKPMPSDTFIEWCQAANATGVDSTGSVAIN